MDYKEEARLAKDEPGAALGLGGHRRSIWAPHWEDSPSDYFSALTCFPRPRTLGQTSRHPAWVAWPLPTVAERVWHFSGRFECWAMPGFFKGVKWGGSLRGFPREDEAGLWFSH